MEDCEAADPSCSCSSEPSQNSPLCQPVNGGTAGTTQYWGGARPGTRILKVLKGVGGNAVIDSICAKITEGPDDYLGYQANYQAIRRRFRNTSCGKCFAKELEMDEQGQVSCAVLEATPLNPDFPDTVRGGYDCAEHGRLETSELQRDFAKGELKDLGVCGEEPLRSCNDFQFCNIPQLSGALRRACLTDSAGPDTHEAPGFCYIDQKQLKEQGQAQLAEAVNTTVGGCPRLMRVVGVDTPRNGSFEFTLCQETDLGDASSSFLEAENPPIPEPSSPYPLPED